MIQTEDGRSGYLGGYPPGKILSGSSLASAINERGVPEKAHAPNDQGKTAEANDAAPQAQAKQQEMKNGERRQNPKEPDGLNPSRKVNIVSEGDLL